MNPEANKASVDKKNLEDNASRTEEAKEKRPVTKEKLRSIMEAASALTALGDEEDGEEGTSNKQQQESNEEGEGKSGKRYIPEHKKPDAALTFPEKLMSMMRRAEKEDPDTFCIAWLPDGKSFVIRNPDEFTRNVLPHYFKATKFSSYTRKLYRWGFRQVNRGIGPDDPIIFGNEYFQRDNVELMVKMRSITAAGTRKAQTIEQEEIEASRGTKRPPPLDAINMMSIEEQQRKRIMLEHMLNQQKFGGLQGIPVEQHNYLQQQATLQQFNLASALRPSMASMQQKQHQMGFTQLNSQAFNPNPLGMYMAPQQQHLHGLQQQHQHHQQLSSMPLAQNQQYNSASTAEIVNAAINALRFAS